MYAFGQALTAVNTAVKVRLIHSEHFFLSPKNRAVKKLSFFAAPIFAQLLRACSYKNTRNLRIVFLMNTQKLRMFFLANTQKLRNSLVFSLLLWYTIGEVTVK